MPKILVVEDNTIWQNILRSQLNGLQGIIDEASCTLDAFGRLDDAARLNAPYDAYILDSMFPEQAQKPPYYEESLRLAREILTRDPQVYKRIFVLGGITPFVKYKIASLGIIHFYCKEKSAKQLWQKHWSQLIPDLRNELKQQYANTPSQISPSI